MINFILAFISGALVKLVDDIVDKEIKWLPAKGQLPIAMLYGLLIGYIISNASFSMLFLGALFAQVISGKIDKNAHILGFFVAILSAIYFGLPGIDYAFFVFLIAAYLDELVLFDFWKTLT